MPQCWHGNGRGGHCVALQGLGGGGGPSRVGEEGFGRGGDGFGGNGGGVHQWGFGRASEGVERASKVLSGPQKRSQKG